MPDFNATPRPRPRERFGEDDQLILLGCLLGRPSIYPSLRPLLLPRYWDDCLRPFVFLMNEHQDQFGCLPSPRYIEIKLGRILPALEPEVASEAWLRRNAAEFARFKAYESAVLDGVDHIMNGRFDRLDADMDAARQVGSGSDAPPFRTMFADETHLVPPPEYLIEPWLVRDTVTCVYGVPGAFKSFWCLHAAMCLATGTAFNGQPVERTGVAYVAAEGQGGIALRQDAWVEHHGVRPGRADLVNICEPVRLLDPAHVQQFITYLQLLQKQHNTRFGLVVLDTYSQCISGAQENAPEVGSAAAQAMIRIRRELGCTVLFVHHLGKDRERGMRGAGNLRGNTDGAVLVERGEERMAATAKVERVKDAPGGATMEFGMKVVPIPRLAGQRVDASLVVEFGTPIPGTDAVASAGSALQRLFDGQVLRQINEAMRVGETCSVKKLIERIDGMHNNTRCKDRIKALLPLDARVEVQDNAGSVLGVLRRHEDQGNAQNTSGLVSRESPPGQRFPLRARGVIKLSE